MSKMYWNKVHVSFFLNYMQCKILLFGSIIIYKRKSIEKTTTKYFRKLFCPKFRFIYRKKKCSFYKMSVVCRPSLSALCSPYCCNGIFKANVDNFIVVFQSFCHKLADEIDLATFTLVFGLYYYIFSVIIACSHSTILFVHKTRFAII